jgi:signal transduction histidine kinase
MFAPLRQAVSQVLTTAIERTQASRNREQRLEELAIENARLVAAAQDKAVWEERQRLARDLHDSVTQALYGVTLHAEAASRLLAAGDLATVAQYLRELQETAQEALDEMRLLIFELRPPILEQAGLVAALQARLGAVEGRVNLEAQLIADGVGQLPAVVEQALYRIAQEALNNALKHARAQRITVALQQTQSTVILVVTDDGIGFDLASTSDTGGLGLRGIAERVAQLGGTFTIQSTPAAGTQLRVEIKL